MQLKKGKIKMLTVLSRDTGELAGYKGYLEVKASHPDVDITFVSKKDEDTLFHQDLALWYRLPLA
jgi:hypothetical protein